MDISINASNSTKPASIDYIIRDNHIMTGSKLVGDCQILVTEHLIIHIKQL